MTESQRAPLLTVGHLSKTFAGTRALSDVSFTLAPGEILALLGHNGSGKSTLVKVLAGVHKPDDGAHIEVEADVHFLHQDLGLIPTLSTVENLGLGAARHVKDLLPVSRREVRAAQTAIARFGGTFDVTVPVRMISPAERTVVALARSTSRWSSERNVLVLDEPTATLHGDEAARLRAVVTGLAKEGVGIIYISHHLNEVMELADRALVLRNGSVALDLARGFFDEDTLVRAISGDTVPPDTGPRAAPPPSGEVQLRVTGLRTKRIADASFEIRAGEIVGVAGLVGSGREELLSNVFGSRPATAGRIEVGGVPLAAGSPRDAIRAGLGFVPADRRGEAAVSTMSGRENLTLASLPRLSMRSPVLSITSERRAALREMAEIRVHPPDTERRFALFSGGNQQKIVIAKWLRTTPAVLLMDEPSQGVDVGARAGIHDLIRDKRGTGTAFLLASSDEDELAELCDRVLVFRDGRISDELTGPHLTRDNILRASLTELEPRQGEVTR